MLFPNPDMLLYIAIADAYAIAVEFINEKDSAKLLEECLKFRLYLQHPKYKQPYGSYTDDTEMSVGCARVLLTHDYPFTPIQFANAWVQEFAYGRRRKGYSPGFQAFLESFDFGSEFLRRINDQSDKNGAAMRAVPIGILPNISQVIATADLQAKITHNTDAGRFAAIAVAVMSHFALYENRPLSQVREYCLEHIGNFVGDLSRVWLKKRWTGMRVKEYPHEPLSISTLQAVMTLITECNSLMEIMITCLNWGGDTDSVAAIAWGIASTRMQSEKLPPFMTDGLEQGKLNTGKVRLHQLGKHLMKKYS